MNITKSQLTSQFERAERSGWLPFFVEAAETITDGYFDEADLLGIASRESNLDPKWLTKAGDKGNGFGLMQADKRSFPEFTQGDGWKDARTGILFGAKVLMHKWTDTMNCVGKSVVVRSSKGGVYGFTGKKVEGTEAQRVVIAAYNAGRWGHYAVSNNRDADSYTTGKDYSRDVMERAKVLRPLVKKWKEDNFAKSVTLPSQSEPKTVQPVTDNSDNSNLPAIQTNDANSTSWDDGLTTLVTDKVVSQVSADQVKTASLSFAAKIWQNLSKPFRALIAMLVAGNVYAWLGIGGVVVLTVVLIYIFRREILSFLQKLTAKIKEKFA